MRSRNHWLVLIVFSVVVLMCLCVSGVSFVIKQQRDEFQQIRGRICSNLIRNGEVSSETACGNGTDPHYYLSVIFPNNIVDADYVEKGMEGFEVVEVFKNPVGGCTRYTYRIHDFLFSQYFIFYVCDGILVHSEFQDW